MIEEPFSDPVNSTAPEISRRGFVSLGAGAALVVADAATASAQLQNYGSFHQPIVAETDPMIVVSRPTLQPKAGTPIDAYAATPSIVTSRTPGVVVVQHGWGVDTQIRDVVRRLAKAGFIAIAPNLYARLGAPKGDNATDFAPYKEVLGKMFAAGFVQSDIIAAHDWAFAQARDGAIGVTGFCVGGGIALQSIVDSKAFAAAVIFYGDVRPGTKPGDPTTPATFDFTTRVTTPLMGNFGGRDSSIKPLDVEAMFARLSVPHDLKIYPAAGHAFLDDQRSSYEPVAAADAWARMVDWFHKYLG